MSAAPLTRWTTAEQFAADPSLEHGYYLLDGKVIEDMGNAQRTHENVKARLHAELLFRLRDQNILSAVLSDSSHQFNDYTVLAPDVSVHMPPRASGKGFFSGSPEIAFEILSPSNTARELDGKARVYWAHGAQAVYIIDPEKQVVYSITRTGEWNPVRSIACGAAVVEAETIWPEAE